MKFKFITILFSVTIFCTACSPDDGAQYTHLTTEDGEELSGGDQTSFIFGAEAFGFASPGLSFEERITFGVGNSLFNQSWVTAPASTTARDGLGPLFNARNCASCHFKDGRGRPPSSAGITGEGLLLRLSVAGTNTDGSNLPHPTYGNQFQDNSILGIDKEGTLNISYQDIEITYPDGSNVILKKPLYTFEDLAYGSLNGVSTSPRVAQQMIGLGLLEAVSEMTIIQIADPNDTNNDSISGKINYVYDIESNSTQIGRFGWKANQPSLKQQVAAAFSGDLGITSSLFPEESCPSQENCTDIPNGGNPELVDQALDDVTFYAASLSVPARRNPSDQTILKGKQLFNSIACAACHTPILTTGTHPIGALSNQTIRPYSDLLLHDMGEGLADNTPDFMASGTEWRTQPLWGIGLIETVNDHTRLLHDGRARTIEEAILWHGGEAESSKNKFMELTEEERAALITFIEDL